jgi:nucleoside-diphosphate-sugar epimerase
MSARKKADLLASHADVKGEKATLLVTGANGFVGSALCRRLRASGHPFRKAVRKASGDDEWSVGDIGACTYWLHALAGVEVVIHLAARVHVMHETAVDPLQAFREVNVAGTERLARQSVAAGVRRLVYVSSIKVNGERTVDAPFRESDAPAPKDPYAVSKAEAEAALWRVATETGLEVVVIRPPLVYGPACGGNFGRLLKLVALGVPLPVGRAENWRSLVSRDNLVDFMMTCAEHPGAAGECFLVSDGEDLSTSELIRRLGMAMGRSVRLLRLPEGGLRAAGRLIGRGCEVERLCSSLQVDIGKARQLLGWVPPVPLDAGLRQAASEQLRHTIST